MDNNDCLYGLYEKANTKNIRRKRGIQRHLFMVIRRERKIERVCVDSETTFVSIVTLFPQPFFVCFAVCLFCFCFFSFLFLFWNFSFSIFLLSNSVFFPLIFPVICRLFFLTMLFSFSYSFLFSCQWSLFQPSERYQCRSFDNRN